MKAWDGRFEKGTEPLMERFSASIGIDWVLFPYDIKGSVSALPLGVRWRQEDLRSRGLGRISTSLRSMSVQMAREAVGPSIRRRWASALREAPSIS